MKLLIAIPALNEEQSIASIIERSLAARERIIETSGVVSAVEITVVSDGSTDGTVDIVQDYLDRIKLITFEHNRGYGAAIKEAWRQSDAELVGFLDADGTCDPLFFGDLCRALDSENADVALGCRLNKKSQMPAVRKLGNIAFASMLSVLSSTRVRDTASGMRVVRRASLPQIMPLPDGLQFTPAMSARAILSEDLKIVEIDMPYHERQGESKLSPGKDGLRFLKVIWATAYLYRPSRPLGISAILLFLVATALMVEPLINYLTVRSVHEWMIYRFVVAHFLGIGSCLLLCAAYLTRRIVTVTLSSASGSGRTPDGLLSRLFTSRLFWYVPLALVVAGGLLVLPSFLDLLQRGHILEHWSRFVAMSLMYSVALILAVTRVIGYAITLVEQRVTYLRGLSIDK